MPIGACAVASSIESTNSVELHMNTRNGLCKTEKRCSMEVSSVLPPALQWAALVGEVDTEALVSGQEQTAMKEVGKRCAKIAQIIWPLYSKLRQGFHLLDLQLLLWLFGNLLCNIRLCFGWRVLRCSPKKENGQKTWLPLRPQKETCLQMN